MVNDQSGLAEKQSLPPAPPLPYEAPQDGALPKRKYTFEVIKDGAMVDNIYLPSDKEFVTLGRLPICDIPMEHPSVSRYHCVIQFRDDGEAYIYDLGSGHGTVLNKQRIQPKSFKKLNVGDQIRFGSSTRTWIFMTDDNEYIEKKEREKEEQLQEYITRKARRSESGNTSEEASAAKGSGSQEDMMDSIHSVTWGFGEDATENAGFLGRLDTDGLNNWERKANAFYYKNPVKSLKTFLEDRGYDVNFEYSETGVGPNYSFIAKVRIPILDNSDMPVFGEGQSSKKKHAEQLAALDACEVLDKCGAFQSNSTAGQKRNRAGGYYDSDDEQDSYYDRSSKPTKNQQKKSEPETFESLTEKLSLVEKTIQELETRLENISDHPTHTKETAKNGADDDLDAYMESLQKDETEKKRKKTLLELSAANKDKVRLERLLRIAAPTTNFKLHESNIKSEKKSLELPSAKNIETKAESQKEAVLAGQDNINPPVTTTTAASQDDLENEKHAPEEEKTKEIKQSPQKRRKVAGPAMPPPSSPQQSSGHSQVKASNDGADADETWVPPSGQTGDGRTSLNEKYGY